MLQAVKDLISRRGRYQSVFKGPEGEWVLADICKHGFVHKPTFVAGDPYQTAFREGARWLALSCVNFTKGDLQRIIDQLNNQSNETPAES